MPDLLDGSTGELRVPGAQQAVEAMLSVPDGVYGAPIGPAEIDHAVEEITDLMLRVGRVVALLYEDVHRAEETFRKAFSDYMTMHAKDGAQLARLYDEGQAVEGRKAVEHHGNAVEVEDGRGHGSRLRSRPMSPRGRNRVTAMKRPPSATALAATAAMSTSSNTVSASSSAARLSTGGVPQTPADTPEAGS